ncbi:MAG TPA: ABC transporter permease [Actinocrinis sp.]|uniref:ABC transporter permease n=1 Tax=Actinocrinis sp. TaxID=1920516 RepID=UPI002DDCCA9A|nr:ABC transporter permease [Actinocrinis sp.]HEV3171499.1 ABC transporter permease [Actinocrinis sp.]
MSTVMITHANRVRPTHQPGFTDLLRSEWTKFKTLRSTWWSLGTMIAVSLGVSIAATSAFTATYDNLGAADKTRFQNDTIGLLLQPGSQFGQLAIAVLGVLLIASEFSTGMIRSTVLAAPRRTPVLAAKAVVLGAVVFVLAEAIAWANFFIGSAIVRKHATVTLSTPGTLRAILGFGLVMSLTAIIALAIGALMRHTAGAISVALGTSLVVPGLLGLIPGSVGQHLSQAMPESAGQLIMDRTLDPGTPYGQWGGLAIIVAWTVGLMALAFISIKRRDV